MFGAALPAAVHVLQHHLPTAPASKSWIALFCLELVRFACTSRSRRGLRRAWLALLLGPHFQAVASSRWPVFGLLQRLSQLPARHSYLALRARVDRESGCCDEACRAERDVIGVWLHTRGFWDGIQQNATSHTGVAGDEPGLFWDIDQKTRRDCRLETRCCLAQAIFRYAVMAVFVALRVVKRDGPGSALDVVQDLLLRHMDALGAEPLQAVDGSWPLLFALQRVETQVGSAFPSEPFFRWLPRDGRVLEAGSYDGKDALRFSRLVPEGQVFSFEPLWRNFLVVARRTRNATNVRAFRCALAATEADSRPLRLARVNSAHAMGSLLNFTEEYSVLYPHVELMPFSSPVRTTTISSWAAREAVTSLDLLWLDLEGLEFEVLSSMPESLLMRTSLVVAETRKVALYTEDSGAATLRDLQTLLRARAGFRLAAVEPGATRHFNAFFLRPSQLLRRHGLLPDALPEI
mmetsp:Transcript_115394/g.359394  ORF Transcript_115394/g.359394 Transcript_115394/m.359394 type:complete len:463 (-) Transcript_115394:505-1893(-)